MAPGVGSAIGGIAVFIIALYFYMALAPTLDSMITNLFTTEWSKEGARTVMYIFFFALVVLAPILTVLGIEGQIK